MTNELKDTGVISQESIDKSLEDISKSEYAKQNRIPLIKGEYRTEMLVKLKDLFMQELYKAVDEEEQACKKAGIEPQMTGDNLKMVEALVEASPNWFFLEALWEFLYKDNIIPTPAELATRANKLNDNLGKLEF